MTNSNTSPLSEGRYFTGLENLTEQIEVLRHGFFHYPEGSLSGDYVAKNGLSARNIISERVNGHELHLKYGVLSGLVIAELTAPDMKSLLESYLSKVDPTDDNDPNVRFLIENIPGKNVREIDGRFRSDFEPTIVALAGLYGFDSECEPTAVARESVVNGFIAAANTVISMCDYWEIFNRDFDTFLTN